MLRILTQLLNVSDTQCDKGENREIGGCKLWWNTLNRDCVQKEKS